MIQPKDTNTEECAAKCVCTSKNKVGITMNIFILDFGAMIFLPCFFELKSWKLNFQLAAGFYLIVPLSRCLITLLLI